MEAIQTWYTRPVFLSSTFKDMHAERDHLRQHVFPKLAEDLRERRCHLEPIDLRMGVETVELAEEEAKELQVLKVCLNEIERSRPFLIVLLGDRYGWVPPEARMRAAAQEAGFATEVTGMSVTALEIEFGILLKEPEQRRRCLFFFRDPLPYEQMPPEVAARYRDAHSRVEAVRASHTKLVALKNDIEEDPEFRPRVYHYRVGWDEDQNRVTGLKDFGELVARKLWDELDPETTAFAQQAERKWEDLERHALAEFVEQRSRDFLGREDITRDLLAMARSTAGDRLNPVESKPETIRLTFRDPVAAPSFTVNYGAAGVVQNTPRRSVTSSDPAPSPQVLRYASPAKSVAWCVCITGDPGSGKSALFAHLYRRIDSEPDILPLAHAAGISPRATSIDSMLRRWIGELAGFLQIRSPLAENASAEDVETNFASLLGRASAQTRVLVLIDALNQFEPTTRARFLTWLPKLWPANARLIATTLAGDQAEVLRSRDGVDVRNLPPLSGTEATSIAGAVCARYRRTLNPEVLRILTTNLLPDGTRAAGNPLWLTLAIQQLNLLDEDDFARADQEFTGTPEQRLHQMVLDVAGHMPPDVVGLYGWLLQQTEKVYGTPFARAFADLVALSRFGWRESDLRSLVPTVARILYPDRRLDVWDDLKLAALRRGFRSHIARRGLAEQWDFFHLQMRQAIHHRNLGDQHLAWRIHSAIADHLEKLPASDPLRQSELMVHLIGADDRVRAARDYGERPYAYGAKAGATQALATHILTGIDPEPNPGLAWVISLPDQLSDEPESAGALCTRFNFDLSDAIANEAKLGTRLALLSATEKVLSGLAAADPTNAEWQHGLLVCHERVANVLLAQGDAAGALTAYRNGLAIAQRLAVADPTNAKWHHNLVVCHVHVGDVLRAQGDAAGAMTAYRDSLAIAQRLAAADPTNAAWQRELVPSHERVGNVLLSQGDAAGALTAYRNSLAIAQRLAAADPTNAAWQRDLSVSHERVGKVLVTQGDVPGALMAYRSSLAIRVRLAAADPPNAEWQRYLGGSNQMVGEALLAQGDAAGALKVYRESLAIFQRLAATDPANADWQRNLAVSHENVGNVLLAQGDAAGALTAYRDSLAIRVRLAAAYPANTTVQEELADNHERVGGLLLSQGDVAGARAAYRDSLTIRERLAAADPTNAAWQRDLGGSKHMVGEALLAQGDAAGALEVYRESLAIFQRLAAVDPTGPVWQHGLAASHGRVGHVLAAQGDAAGALKSYHGGLAIFQRLTAADPSNAIWQRELSVSHEKVGDVLVAQGDPAGALKAYRDCLAIRERLAAADPTNADWQHGLYVSHIKLGDMLAAQGDAAGALKAYRDSLAIAQRLAAADPTNAAWQRDLWVSCWKIADLLEKQRDREAAGWWRRAYDILADMSRRGLFVSTADQRVLEQLKAKLGR